MATNFTDYQDPFDLLLSLNNASLQRIYGNPFARGNRSDMNMGYEGRPSSQVGRVSQAQYGLDVNAPSRMFDRSVGSGGAIPKAPEIRYGRDYGNAPINRDELKRLGSVAGPLIQKAASTFKTIAERRASDKESAQNKEMEEAEARRVAGFDPQVQRYGELKNEMGEIQGQIDRTKLTLNAGKGLMEQRTQQRQAQGRQMLQQNEALAQKNEMLGQIKEGINQFSAQRLKSRQRESLNTIAGNIPEATTSTLSKVPGINPYGMLTTPDETRSQRVSKAMESLFSEPGLPPPSGRSASGSFNVPWSSDIPIGPSEPVGMAQKAQNTATLSTATKKPSGSRRKMPAPPPPAPPTMPPPASSNFPPPPGPKKAKNTKAPSKTDKKGK